MRGGGGGGRGGSPLLLSMSLQQDVRTLWPRHEAGNNRTNFGHKCGTSPSQVLLALASRRLWDLYGDVISGQRTSFTVNDPVGGRQLPLCKEEVRGACRRATSRWDTIHHVAYDKTRLALVTAHRDEGSGSPQSVGLQGARRVGRRTLSKQCWSYNRWARPPRSWGSF